MIQNVYLDNNFFNLRLTKCDPNILAQSFTSAGLRWCLSEELLLELFNSARQSENIEKRQKMQYWASFCLALWPNSEVFRKFSQIILEELKRKLSDIFYEKEEIKPIKGLLEKLSKGEFNSNILLSAFKSADELKNSDNIFHQKLQGLRQGGAKRLVFVQFSKVLLNKVLNDVQSQDVERKTGEIMSDLSVFPHVRTFLFTAHSLSYKRTGKSHYFDQRHLVYATDMDYFVSDDNQMAILAKQIFQTKPKVVTQKYFFKIFGICI